MLVPSSKTQYPETGLDRRSYRFRPTHIFPTVAFFGTLSAQKFTTHGQGGECERQKRASFTARLFYTSDFLQLFLFLSSWGVSRVHLPSLFSWPPDHSHSPGVTPEMGGRTTCFGWKPYPTHWAAYPLGPYGPEPEPDRAGDQTWAS